ncbi:extensin [Streptomyces sp. NPDC059785]|uniref:extensin n=1 Tax=Streptomyces sp. NPDC059785 TaxID=3346945 RepID=UPI003669B7F6
MQRSATAPAPVPGSGGPVRTGPGGLGPALSGPVPLGAVPAAAPMPLPVQRTSVAAPASPAPAVVPPSVARGTAPQVQRVLDQDTAPPAYTASAPPSPPGGPLFVDCDSEEPPPAYTRVPFDPRALTDGQVDELTHKLAGPITRLLRTELRLERERIGKLRDPRR